MLNIPPTQDHTINHGIDNVNEYGSRSYFDPIHGYIKLDKQYWEIIDTCQFQRLRNLKQLGCVFLVFPSATHNRFEHCIGTCYLARKMMNNIRKHQKLLDVTERDVFNVSVAGLCHDLGHGPFSHVFDNFFMKKVSPQETWTHEDASAMLLEHMVEQNKIDLERDDVRFIQDLILGHSEGYAGKEKMWLFDIVNNKRNSIDVDKFDYIMRDTHMMDLPYGVFDYQILLKNGRVIDDQICYPEKNAFEVIKLFQSRYELYRDIYNHRTVHSVELLLCDVLLESHKVLYDYTEAIRDPEQYQKLTDNVIFEIEMSEDPRLKKAQETIKRIKRREFYLFAGEKVIPNKLVPNSNFFTEKDVVNCSSISSDGIELFEDDIVLRSFKVNFAMGEKNPFENVKFYHSNEYDYCQPIDMNTVSAITPSIFQEMILRLFVKDGRKFEVAQTAFNRFCKENLGGTPIKQKDHIGQSTCSQQYSLSQMA